MRFFDTECRRCACKSASLVSMNVSRRTYGPPQAFPEEVVLLLPTAAADYVLLLLLPLPPFVLPALSAVLVVLPHYVTLLPPGLLLDAYVLLLPPKDGCVLLPGLLCCNHTFCDAPSGLVCCLLRSLLLPAARPAACSAASDLLYVLL